MSKVYIATKADLPSLAGCKVATGTCSITSVSKVVNQSPRVVIYSGNGSVNTGFTQLRLLVADSSMFLRITDSTHDTASTTTNYYFMKYISSGGYMVIGLHTLLDDTGVNKTYSKGGISFEYSGSSVSHGQTFSWIAFGT